MIDRDEDDGLPDEAFTETELAAGVQHIVRSGNRDALARWRTVPSHPSATSPALSPGKAPRFDTFAQARSWARANPGVSFASDIDGQGFVATTPPVHCSEQAGANRNRTARRTYPPLFERNPSFSP